MNDEAGASEELGPVVSRHPVANQKRWANAGWALVIGVLAGWVGLWGLVSTGGDGLAGSRKAVGVLLGLGLSGLFIAVTQTVRAVRGGPAEYFEVRERGVVYGSRRGTAGWPWDQVATITMGGTDTENGVTRRLGTGYRCLLRFADGRRARVDGLAEQHVALGIAVLSNCPDAPRLTGGEWQRRWGGRLLAAAAACLAAIAAMILYLVGHPDREQVTVDSRGLTTEHFVPGVSETGVAVLTLGMLACLVAAITFVVLFVRGRRGY
ncbi:hypothetical protein ACH4GP_07150 [Streptomyces celluloflavus]|uniref:PH domain-containing protein n=1 Tax=Streptomyces celluloflavus TaxID=58344 RepID=A0ABW7R8R3_9ACTN